jgi:enamine deaminase RidA (YjgF/YER057c/UK114 family)
MVTASLVNPGQVRDEYISLDKPPASTLVQVSSLVNPAFRVEIDALAAI